MGFQRPLPTSTGFLAGSHPSTVGPGSFFVVAEVNRQPGEGFFQFSMWRCFFWNILGDCIYTSILKWYCIDGLLSSWRSFNSTILQLNIHMTYQRFAVWFQRLGRWNFCLEETPNIREKMTISNNQTRRIPSRTKKTHVEAIHVNFHCYTQWLQVEETPTKWWIFRLVISKPICPWVGQPVAIIIDTPGRESHDRLQVGWGPNYDMYSEN